MHINNLFTYLFICGIKFYVVKKSLLPVCSYVKGNPCFLPDAITKVTQRSQSRSSSLHPHSLALALITDWLKVTSRFYYSYPNGLLPNPDLSLVIGGSDGAVATCSPGK